MLAGVAPIPASSAQVQRMRLNRGGNRQLNRALHVIATVRTSQRLRAWMIKESGPAPRSMDRFAHVIEKGVLTVDTGRITLGPLPLALGAPGLVPPRSPTRCL